MVRLYLWLAERQSLPMHFRFWCALRAVTLRFRRDPRLRDTWLGVLAKLYGLEKGVD